MVYNNNAPDGSDFHSADKDSDTPHRIDENEISANNAVNDANEHKNRIQSVFEAFLDKYGDLLTVGDWHIELNGVYRSKDIRNKKGEIIDSRFERASPIPVLPTAILTNVESHIEKIEISFFKFGSWKKVIVPRSNVASKTSIVKLSDDGIEVDADSAGSLMRYLSETVANSLETIPRSNAKSSLGWSDVGFLPYADGIVFDGDRSYRTLYDSVRQKGDLQEWVDYMRPLRNNLDFRLTMAAAFASPLLELIGENCFIFHLWGGTGSGKTVAIMSAMSVWGDPSNGKLVRTMNMTQNAMLSTASFLRNLPFAGDELQTIKTNIGNYDQLIMKITEGIDRARMRMTELVETKSWRCSFIFTGEEPIIKPESGGGAKNRVIEIECKTKLIENGNAVANFVRTHYGNAGKAYIAEIEQIGAERIIDSYRSFFDGILSECNTTDKQAGAMAILLIADYIASQLFWTDENVLSPSDVKQYLFTESDVDISERAYQFVLASIAENASKFDDTAPICWGKIESGCCFFNKTVLNRILQADGFSLRAVVRKWFDKGYIKDDASKNFRTLKKINGIPVPCITFILPKESNSGQNSTWKDRIGQNNSEQVRTLYYSNQTGSSNQGYFPNTSDESDLNGIANKQGADNKAGTFNQVGISNSPVRYNPANLEDADLDGDLPF